MKQKIPEIQISFRGRYNPFILPKVNDSREAAKLFINNWGNKLDTVEEFKVMYLNHAKGVKGIYTLSKGGITNLLLDYRVMFGIGVKIFATSIIVAHNHTSGNLLPSNQDKKCTNEIIRYGEILRIPLVEHLIISPTLDYFSFFDNGYI